jgi:hypothetical protein
MAAVRLRAPEELLPGLADPGRSTYPETLFLEIHGRISVPIANFFGLGRV